MSKTLATPRRTSADSFNKFPVSSMVAKDVLHFSRYGVIRSAFVSSNSTRYSNNSKTSERIVEIVELSSFLTRRQFDDVSKVSTMDKHRLVSVHSVSPRQ
ncbi:Uncharacterized protein APZ42_001325 [Daphnia magna]|uniref:Uncharacterized protein n=1 Tax=Daphnia magna TaxID=35525 RepID=A0A164J203_9CRUS|nr:Uncharacterized protein APZ42_001325 [Daphnia magna]